MDNKDVYSVCSDIMDAVNDAVGKGDFSSLNATLKDVTGAAAGTAADALYSLQGHLQGQNGGRTYGHAGRSSSNVTEEYMKRASGARHHTVFSSRLSPFLQRKVSKASGTGSIVGGIVSLVFSGIMLLETVAAGLIGSLTPFAGTGFTVWTIISLVVAGGLAVLGGVLIKSGNERKKLVREYYEYGKIAGTAEYLEIGKLARAMGESRETVLNNLEKMISEDMLPAAWFDRQKTTLILSEELYNEYLRLERERQAQQEAEAKAKMQQRAGSGTGEFAAGAAADLPDDLKPTPEDAKLPENARKIVEEGLLYMGRIRAYNDEIPDEEISLELSDLELTMKRILDKIRKDPAAAPNLRRLMVYYLPTTMKLLQAYKELDRQPAAGQNIVSTKQEIREALGTINTAFDNLLDSLFQDMAWDISSDISVMKTMMAQDGLTGQKLRAGKSGSAGAQTPGEKPAQAPAGGQAMTFDGYTDGYTEGLAEDTAGETGAAYAEAPASSSKEEEEDQGIRLTFGE